MDIVVFRANRLSGKQWSNSFGFVILDNSQESNYEVNGPKE